MPTRGPAASTSDLGTGTGTFSGTTGSITPASIPPLGVLAVFGLAWNAASGAITAVTDNAGVPNTWSFRQNLTSSLRVARVSALITDRSLTTINFTISGSAFTGNLALWAGSYLSGSAGGYPSPTEDVGGSANGSGTGAVTSTLTPTLSNYSVGWQVAANATNGTGMTPTSGWTEVSDAGNATALARLETSWRIINGKVSTTFGTASSGVNAVTVAASIFPCDVPLIRPQSSVQIYRTMPGVLSGSR